MTPDAAADTAADPAADPAAQIVTDGDDRILSWNRRAEEIFGYAAAEALGRRLPELIDVAGIDDRREATPVDALTVHVEGLRRRRDGTLIVVASTARQCFDAAGRPSGRAYVKTDITRFRARRDARVVAARWEPVLAAVADAIVMVNATGRIVFVNRQALAMFGHAREAMLGEPVEMLLPARAQAGHAAHRIGFIRAPSARPMGEGLELNGLRRDGSEVPVEVSLSPVDSEVGPLVIGAIRDISERRRFERALQEKNLELERANRAKDQFLATMSHELRTPLNAIIGFTGLLLMGLPGPLTAEQERQLRAVQGSGRHLLSLINDLLDLARIESGKSRLQPEPVAAAALMQEVAMLMRPAAEAKGLALHVDLPDGDLTLHADRRALHQVLLNLLANALKFTARGEVRLSLHHGAAAGAAAPGAVELAVTDTGSGIDPGDLERLFQPFSRVGDSASRAQEGTGLGLHLSARLAELMGGSLRCDSEPGRGSRFTLRLPAAPG